MLKELESPPCSQAFSHRQTTLFFINSHLRYEEVGSSQLSSWSFLRDQNSYLILFISSMVSSLSVQRPTVCWCVRSQYAFFCLQGKPHVNACIRLAPSIGLPLRIFFKSTSICGTCCNGLEEIQMHKSIMVLQIKSLGDDTSDGQCGFRCDKLEIWEVGEELVAYGWATITVFGSGQASSLWVWFCCWRDWVCFCCQRYLSLNQNCLASFFTGVVCFGIILPFPCKVFSTKFCTDMIRHQLLVDRRVLCHLYIHATLQHQLLQSSQLLTIQVKIVGAFPRSGQLGALNPIRFSWSPQIRNLSSSTYKHPSCIRKHHHVVHCNKLAKNTPD